MNTPRRALPQVLERIAKGKISRDDIKYSDRLTTEQIASIPSDNVFQYIKENSWSYKDFMKWLESFSEEVDDE